MCLPLLSSIPLFMVTVKLAAPDNRNVTMAERSGYFMMHKSYVI